MLIESLKRLPSGSLAAVILVLLGLVFLGKWLKNRRSNGLLNKLPSVPGLPILGNALVFLKYKNPVRAFSHLCDSVKNYDGIIRARIFDGSFVLVSKPEYLKEIYMGKNVDRADVYEYIGDVLGDGVLVSNGSKWKVSRKIYAHHLLSSSAPHHEILKLFQKYSKPLVAELEEKASHGEFFKILEPLQVTSTNSIMEYALGETTPAELQRLICEDVGVLMKFIFLRMFSPVHFFKPIFNLTPAARVYYRMRANARKVAAKILEKKKQDLEEMKNNGETVPSKFIFSLFKHNPEETTDYIFGDFITIVPTAIDTTTQTIGFLLTLLGLHPEVEERVFQEDRDICKALEGRVPTLEDMKMYEYLEMVIKETLRIFPIAPFVGRKMSEDTYFGKYLVPAGTDVLAFQMRTNYDSQYFPEPMKFNPERFAPKNISSIPPYAYNPFSQGPRSCPGSKYGMLSLKTFVSEIIRKFKIIPKYNTLQEVMDNCVTQITLHDKNSFTLRLERRME